MQLLNMETVATLNVSAVPECFYDDAVPHSKQEDVMMWRCLWS